MVVKLHAVLAAGIDLILLLLYLGQEHVDIVPTQHEGNIFKLLSFLVMINDELWLHHGHRNIE